MVEIKVTCDGADLVELDRLKPFQGKLKEISSENLGRMKESLKKYGWSFPAFVWREDTTYWMLDCHQRVKAMRELLKEGYTIGKVPVDYIQARDKKEAKEKLLLVNSHYAKITAEGFKEFTVDLNLMELTPLLELPDVDLTTLMSADTGAGTGAGEDDFTPPKEAKYKITAGDLFILGKHRLLCGDSTKKEDVERLMDNKKADMVFTDPPYGMNKGFKNDELKGDNLREWNEKWIKNFLVKDNSVFVCFHSPRLFWTALDAGRNQGWKIERYFAYYKPNDMAFPWHSWLGVSEAILLFSKGKPEYNSEKPNDTSFWHDTYYWTHKNLVINESKTDGQSCSHPTMKPIPVCSDLIWKYSFKNNVVLDLFLGSGSTLVACEQTGRVCYGCEIDPYYVSVCLERYVKFVGGDADVFRLNEDGSKTSVRDCVK